MLLDVIDTGFPTVMIFSKTRSEDISPLKDISFNASYRFIGHLQPKHFQSNPAFFSSGIYICFRHYDYDSKYYYHYECYFTIEDKSYEMGINFRF